MAQIEVGLQNQTRLPGVDDGQTSDSSWAFPRPQPYYSNKDITILHRIVSAAQEQFDRSPYPKPLPAAVLFKAYDDILPTFGIDPDSDHHLSVLVFRISGETGNGSLLEKLHGLLKRMGIILEFDDATSSEISSATPSTPRHLATVMSGLQTSGSQAADEDKENAEPYLKPSGASVQSLVYGQSSHHELITDNENCRDSKMMQALPDPTQDLRQQTQDASLEALTTEFRWGPRETCEPPENPAVKDAKKTNVNWGLRKPAIIRAIDRWRKLTSGEMMTGEKTKHTSVVIDDGERPQNLMNNVSTTKNLMDCGLSSFQTQIATEAAAHDLSDTENDALLLRAVRARQIFLASRILNRWADETAIRLEREAIARRHMVRFRCFNSWLQAPDSKLPRIRHLKARSAVQKLQRVVACQAGQLESASSLTATSRIRRKALRMLNFWRGNVLSRLSANKMTQLVGETVLNCWLVRSREYNRLRSNTSWFNRQNRTQRELLTWMNHQTKHEIQHLSAQRLAVDIEGLRWLRSWRGHTETSLRADSCRQVLAMELLARGLEIWRLQARAEAFRRKREQAFAMGYIDGWLAAVARNSMLQVSSEGYCRSNFAKKLATHIVSFTQTQQELDVLEHRASWYIRATVLLQRVSAVVRSRKQQMKLVVRHHLMMRYTQVSSKRRRRSFYAALTQWQAHAATLEEMVRVADSYQALGSMNRRRSICALWERRAVQEAEAHVVADNLRREHFLHEWIQRASVNRQQELNAVELWAAEQQRQSVKTWARSTLQKGGQAHSAKTVRQRYERDHRNRAFQRWRHLARRSKPVDIFPGPQSPIPAAPINKPSHRIALKHSKWTPLSRRFDYKQEALTPIHTPSRSTGLLFPSTHAPLLRFTDPVAETDTNRRLAKSVAGGTDLWKRTVTSREHMSGKQGALPTTTPKAPVPSHVKIPSRHVSALTTPSLRGQATRAPDSTVVGSRSRINKGIMDGETPFHKLPSSESHVRLHMSGTGSARMRRMQSFLRNGITTPSMTAMDALQETDGTEFV